MIDLVVLDEGLVVIQVNEELKNLLFDLFDPGGLSIDLIDDNYRLDLCLNRLFEDKNGLSFRAFSRANKQHHSVDHRHDPLHLSSEVLMPRSVHQIDEVIFVHNSSHLRPEKSQ